MGGVGMTDAGLNEDEPVDDGLSDPGFSPDDALPPWVTPPGAPPMDPPAAPASPASGASAAPAGPVLSTADNAAHLILVVPADAELWFNGVSMRTTGRLREFASPPLTPGLDYSYEVRVRWFEAGRAIDRTRKVIVRANLRLKVDMTQPQTGDATRAP
jgi:uncharacterized protein (TIGR03000 family)